MKSNLAQQIEIISVNYGGRAMSLEILVANFRKAIEAAKENYERGELFRNFPVGQCGHASDILSQYLIDNGFRTVTVSYTHLDVYKRQGWQRRWELSLRR